jgi:hypothetical protein
MLNGLIPLLPLLVLPPIAKEILTDLSVILSIRSLALNELRRNGFVEILIVGDVVVAVVMIVVVKISSANGLLRAIANSIFPFSIVVLLPVVTGTLIFSTTPPCKSEKCVTVTLSFLFVFLSRFTGVGVKGGISEGKLHILGVVGDERSDVDADGLDMPPFKFNVNLSPP